MSSLAILTAATAITQAAVSTDVLVLSYPPKTINGETLVYLAHHTPSDVPKANGLVFRTHHITIRLMVRATAGDETAVNATFLPLADAISNAFYGHHTLNGTVGTADLRPVATGGGSGADYIEFRGVEYRQREWTLDAVETVGVTFA